MIQQESQDIASNDSGTAAETVMIDKLNDPQATEERIEEIIADSQKLDMKECFNKYPLYIDGVVFVRKRRCVGFENIC